MQQQYLPSHSDPQFVRLQGSAAHLAFQEMPTISWADTEEVVASGHLASYPVARPEDEVILPHRTEGVGSGWQEAPVYGSPVPDEPKSKESKGNMGLMIGAVVIIGLGLTFYS